MSVPPSVAEILDKRVTLVLDGIDRMYLNVYQPRLQAEAGIAGFLRNHLGYRFASSALLEPISEAFVAAIERFALDNGIPVVAFQKGERKDDIAAPYRAAYQGEEGVLFIGKAQEKVRVIRTRRRHDPKTGRTYPWLYRSTAMVNQFYFYAVDRDFGPFFLKFSSYFPYNAKLCINGHEYLKRQLARRGVAFEALDNGLLSCADPALAQRLCDELSADKIDALLRKWLRRLPHPFTRADREANYRYDISILQAEFSRTLVLDRPVSGRIFFEDVIRENLDLGRPDQVQLLFLRRISRRTPGRFRTRVITDGVIPSLHIEYKKTGIKLYYKEGRALRIETTINDTRDFGIGKRLVNLPALREIGFPANRRLLDVIKVSHDCTIGEDAFRQVVRPVIVDGHRAAGLRFDDPRVQALFAAVLGFVFQPQGFANHDVRARLAQLLGVDPATLTQGQMTYHLRRLRLHGLIHRIQGTHRYALTPLGLRLCTFISRVYARVLRPGLSQVAPLAPPATSGRSSLQRAFDSCQRQVDRLIEEQRLAS
jgi:hypothetical protein